MRKIAILCDFDGTIARDDVGNLLFRTLTQERSMDVVRRWRAGEISSRECLEQEVALVGDVDTVRLDGFVKQRALDPFFRDFHDFARKRGIEVVILSDGLDYYIERMLMRNGRGDIEFYANHLAANGGKLSVSFPWHNLLECTECGCCKTFHLFRYRDQGFYIVYVGDGLSDRCPSEAADLVFAKGALLDHCRSRGIAHVEFENFRDVEREVIRRLVVNGDSEEEE